MTNQLTTTNPALPPVIAPGDLAAVGQVANQVAARRTFDDYSSGKAENTRRRHIADLATFARFLSYTGVTIQGDRSAEAHERLAADPGAWTGMTWGIVAAFKAWQIEEGYSIGSVNARLSTVKVFAALAAQAGAIDGNEAALITSIRGYSHMQGRNINKAREKILQATRKGHKKPEWVSLTKDQADRLKSQPDTPQGRRDALLICLMLDHGLRCGEVAHLEVSAFDLKAGKLRFYRRKVDKEQTHKLSPGTLAAARRYLAADGPALGPLLRGSRKDGSLAGPGMSEQAITARVKALGERLGLSHLSAHDLRHYWATTAARSGTPVDRLQQAGGWTSPAMALRYVEQAKIANEGVKLE